MWGFCSDLPLSKFWQWNIWLLFSTCLTFTKMWKKTVLKYKITNKRKEKRNFRCYWVDSGVYSFDVRNQSVTFRSNLHLFCLRISSQLASFLEIVNVKCLTFRHRMGTFLQIWTGNLWFLDGKVWHNSKNVKQNWAKILSMRDVLTLIHMKSLIDFLDF